MQHGPAASSGSNPKAPGSAGGYLLSPMRQAFFCDHNYTLNTRRRTWRSGSRYYRPPIGIKLGLNARTAGRPIGAETGLVSL
jgi:hypothetical protein